MVEVTTTGRELLPPPPDVEEIEFPFPFPEEPLDD
jgi:hypothetical protein